MDGHGEDGDKRDERQHMGRVVINTRYQFMNVMGDVITLMFSTVLRVIMLYCVLTGHKDRNSLIFNAIFVENFTVYDCR